MGILSTKCQCSACTKKYGCSIYGKIVEMQRLTNRYVHEKEVVIRFQVESCELRVTDE